MVKSNLQLHATQLTQDSGNMYPNSTQSTTRRISKTSIFIVYNIIYMAKLANYKDNNNNKQTNKSTFLTPVQLILSDCVTPPVLTC